MWTENEKIRNAVLDARATGITARHRISVPDFERFLGGEEESKDKPLNTYVNVTKDNALSAQVQALLTNLTTSEHHEPFLDEALGANGYLPWLKEKVLEWAHANKLQDEVRFKGP
jgi:hypothetical protein